MLPASAIDCPPAMAHGNIGVFLERWEKFGAEEDNENFLTSYCGQQHSPYFSVN